MNSQLVWAWTIGMGFGIALASAGIALLVFTVRARHEVHVVRSE